MKSKLLFALTLVAGLPLVTLAGGGQGFTPLVGIPGLPSGGSFDGYVDALYALAISVAALVAVVKIVLAGAKYMMDDIVTHKSEAKEDIKNALIGLLIIIGAVIILNTINSDLTNLAITAPPVEVDNTRPPFIDRAAEVCDASTERNSSCSSFSCVISDVYSATTCAEDCRVIGGSFDSGWTYDTCTYARDTADQCNPQQSEICCERIKAGDWDSETSNCSGLAESRENRIAACQLANRIWNEELDTCTNRPAPPADSQNRRTFPNANTLRNTIVPGTPPTASQLDILNRECSFAFGEGWEFDSATTECVNN